MPVGAQKPTLLSNDDNLSRLWLLSLSKSNIELYMVHMRLGTSKLTYESNRTHTK